MLRRGPWPVILQIVPELSTGGAERTTVEMAEAVTLGGGRALVLSQGGRLEDELREVGGEFIPFPARTKNPAAMLVNALRLASLAGARGVSLIHARSRAPAWSAWLAAKRSRRRLVTTYHGIYGQNGRLKGMYNSVMARGDTVICNSHYTASVVRARHPWAAARLTVIHRGVDIAKFDAAAVSPARVEALRRRWRMASPLRIVLVPGRLTRWKGQQLLIEAVSRMSADETRDVAFVLAGDDQGRSSYRIEIEQMIATLGPGKRIVIAGHCDDMPAAYKAATLTVIPSIEPEAFGRVSIEAQAMGCPVILANIGALPETISPSRAGLAQVVNATAGCAIPGVPEVPAEPWLFEAGNTQALRAMLARALALGEEQLRPIRERAIERVRLHFSKQRLQEQTLAVYDALLGTQLCLNFRAATRG